jgi:hypothetical protein
MIPIGAESFTQEISFFKSIFFSDEKAKNFMFWHFTELPKKTELSNYLPCVAQLHRRCARFRSDNSLIFTSGMPCRVCIPLYFCFYFEPGSVYIGKYPERGEISADVIWGKNMRRVKKIKRKL